ncbi:MAG: hypothetical protein RLZZ196_3221, partial [Bacteroidota bacterium]
MKNFSNYLYTSNQGDSKVFLEMLKKLDQKFSFLDTEESADFTGPAFTDLYPIVINFYKTHFP